MNTVTSNFTKEITTKFILGYLTNINTGYIATEENEEESIKKIENVFENSNFQKEFGEWEIVWGPCISTSKTKEGTILKKEVTDNAMYLARKKGEENYVLGIAGTNSISYTGWFDEDFDVETTQSWPLSILDLKETTHKGNIASGTATGFDKLWNMKGNEKCSLWEYISNNLSNCSISVSGHSLGGALTPVMAVGLADKIAESDKVENIKISAYPFAGPTPGDVGFANHIADVLEEYHAVYNEMDIVPLSWGCDDLSKIPSLYDTFSTEKVPFKGENTMIKNFIDWAISRSQKSNINYVRKPQEHRDNFIVSTWNNGMLDNTVHNQVSRNTKNYPDKKRTSYEVFTDKAESLNKILNGEVKLHGEFYKDLKTINNNIEPRSNEIEEFADFLTMAGLQHTVAYSSTSEKGFKIPDMVMDLFSDIIERHKKKVKDGLEGSILFKKLLDSVAIYVEKQKEFAN